MLISYSYYHLCHFPCTGVVIDSKTLDNHTVELFSNNFNLSIYCTAFSLVECYAVKYKWHKDGELISTTSVLIINNLKMEDEGQYQCTAFNSVGGTDTKTVSVATKGKILRLFIYILYSYKATNALTVVLAPMIVLQPNNSSAAAPFSAVFICSAIAYGVLSFEWKRSNYSDLPPKSFTEMKLSLNGTISYLFIPNVTKDDEDGYRCEAWANNLASRSNIAMLQFSGACSYNNKYACTYVTIYYYRHS